MPTIPAPPPVDSAFSEKLIHTVLELSPTAIQLWGPLHGPGGDLVDFALEYSNPAGRRMLGLPARTASTMLTCFPHARETGLFDFYRRAFETAGAGRHDGNYPYNGPNNFFQFATQRHGPLLVVSFAAAPGSHPPRAPRQERENFYQIFQQTPAAISIQRGPEHRYEYHNAAYQQFFPDRELLGRTVAEALPETVEAGIVALLDAVYQTGETYFGYNLPLLVAQPDGRPPRRMYFTFTYQAYREDGEIVGISTLAYDVTEPVLARQQGEAQLHKLFEQAPVAIAVFRGPRYVVELANPAVCALWGRTPAQALGTPLFELLPEAAGQGFE